MCPIEPPTTMSIPFIEMPQRGPASPSITSSPPCPDAPAHCEALPRTRTVPDIMFSATPVPQWPLMTTEASWFIPAAVIADMAVDLDRDQAR